MTWDSLSLAGQRWLWPVVLLVLVAWGALVWAWARSPRRGLTSALAAALKGLAVLLLAVCVLEPQRTGTRPRPGSNLFLLVGDNSRSLTIAEQPGGPSRADRLRPVLADEASWQVRLGQDFEVRRYRFDEGLQPAPSLAQLDWSGAASNLAGALQSLAERIEGRPVAGILLLTDGNATDLADLPETLGSLPPLYPVVFGGPLARPDLAINRVEIGQSSFEAAPVTLTAHLQPPRLPAPAAVVRVLDEAGVELERRSIPATSDGGLQTERFLLRPDKPGLIFYGVEIFFEDEPPGGPADRPTREATLDNNSRSAVVDRGGGPFRVLYVGGRPGWEFKFLRRALGTDPELELTGLIRIARQEPRFVFLGRSGERTNPLFRGFETEADADARQYDEPVLIRLGTRDQEELRRGFPREAAELFPYHAVILDDVESGFFSTDQLLLLQQFVARRGGGFLMLGGYDSFAEGSYRQTPLAELLPVYLDKPALAPEGPYRLSLTREGWLQPWVRLRAREAEEQQRLEALPAFATVNPVASIKPGGAVLAEVETGRQTRQPALVVQPFGRGRSAALLVGDLWRWHMRRENPEESDAERAWRQMIRWLVADVPQRVEVQLGTATPATQPVRVFTRDEKHQSLDNTTVSIELHRPDGSVLPLAAEPDATKSGESVAQLPSRGAGRYRAEVAVQGPDGQSVGRRTTGWVVEPQANEFRELDFNRPVLARLADQTGGELVPLERLEEFVASLPSRRMPITETWTHPLWDQVPVYVAAAGCLLAAWAFRRLRGLP
jgi:uncharacterized membrane protein